MNAFANAFLEEENYTLTANGADTFKSSLNANLDFFGQAGAMRGQESEFLELFRLAWQENPKLALQNLFYMRDIRNGVGERDLFIKCFGYIADKLSDDDFSKVLPFIPEYGRWADVFKIMEYVKNVKFFIASSFVTYQVSKDIEDMKNGKSISLLAKWFPLANNRHTKDGILFARKLATSVFGNDRDARKVIVALRKYLNVLEQKMCSGNWSDIDYEKVPSIANMKYRNAFLKNDMERRTAYLDAVESGEAKINASVAYPYDIVQKVMDLSEGRFWEWDLTSIKASENDIKLLDGMWNNLADYTNGSSSIAVVDLSGSMFSKYTKTAPMPVCVAVGLGIYFAERNKSDFQNMFINFSDEADLQKIKGDNIVEKVNSVFKSKNIGYNTNVLSVFQSYLKLAKKCKPEDCPKNIVMISDMEFDDACGYGYYGEKQEKLTNFQKIEQMFEEAGIARPNLIFWDVNASGRNVPVTKDESGTVLVSGYSPALFQYICNGSVTPEKFMLDVLGKYAKVTEDLTFSEK